jgi:hypothetical protein
MSDLASRCQGLVGAATSIGGQFLVHPAGQDSFDWGYPMVVADDLLFHLAAVGGMCALVA